MTLAAVKRLVKETPLCKISEAREGLMAVKGRARALKKIQSPLLGVNVVAYQIYCRAVTNSGRRLELSFARANNFVVEDGTGSIEVVSYNAYLMLKHEYQTSSGSADSFSFDVLRALRKECDADLTHVRMDSFEWNAYFLEEREPCYVVGDCRLVVDTEQTAIHYRESARKPTLRAPKESPLVVSEFDRVELEQRLSGYFQ
ncbi:MAG: hypothetical protein KC503_39625 [Myxococcales bacterium]|nr:hypothetical protein [Myxococcales bacterium]